MKPNSGARQAVGVLHLGFYPATLSVLVVGLFLSLLPSLANAQGGGSCKPGQTKCRSRCANIVK